MTDPYEYLFNKLGVKWDEYVIFLNNKIVDFKPKRETTYKDLYFQYQQPILDLTGPEFADFRNLLRQIKLFPEVIESKEHVDLLLTLHGINKGA